MCGRCSVSGIGSVWVVFTIFTMVAPHTQRVARCRRFICVAVAEGKVQRETRKPPRPVTGAAVKPGCRPDQGGLFLRFGGGTAFPLGEVVGDHPRRFHRGLAELGEARELALNALTFAVHEAAKAIEFGDQ